MLWLFQTLRRIEAKTIWLTTLVLVELGSKLAIILGVEYIQWTKPHYAKIMQGLDLRMIPRGMHLFLLKCFLAGH